MKRFRLTASAIVAAILLVLVPAAAWAQSAATGGPYRADWKSLEKHEPAPEWFRDAKFGIYFHWGVYSVPAFGSEWYPRNMHIKSRPEYKHHLETYGGPVKFPYDKFVPMFKAEHFDAEAWAELFRQAGARFAGPVAEHHDGFSMWASQVTPWNAKDRGPQQDITGELEKAIRARGMRFITTFHHARNNLWRKNGDWTGHYEFAKKDFPEVLEDPERAVLYGYMPREEFLEFWLKKLVEVIDHYQPDIIWFDSWLDEIPEKYRREFLAYYLNKAASWNRDVVITFKQRDLPRSVGVEDYEKGRADRLTEFVWLTDDTISRGSWCYTQDLKIKPTEEVLHSLIDIVSKNGVLLLNLSPKADGTIPENQQQVLREIGQWLGVCGEAIYETRPWLVFGEGPTRLGKGGAFIRWQGRYTPQDIRYTRSKDGKTVYAIALGWPGEQLILTATQVAGRADGAEVTLLGYDQPLKFSVNEQKQLVVDLPDFKEDQLPTKYAFAFRLQGFELALQPSMAAADRFLSLPADRALLDGEKLRLEEKSFGTNIGFWDDPEERVHWLVKVPKAGTYAVRGEFATQSKASRLALQVDDQRVEFNVRVTGGWDRPRWMDAGKLEFARPGVYHLILAPADPAQWSAVNVWGLQLIRQP